MTQEAEVGVALSDSLHRHEGWHLAGFHGVNQILLSIKGIQLLSVVPGEAVDDEAHIPLITPRMENHLRPPVACPRIFNVITINQFSNVTTRRMLRPLIDCWSSPPRCSVALSCPRAICPLLFGLRISDGLFTFVGFLTFM